MSKKHKPQQAKISLKFHHHNTFEPIKLQQLKTIQDSQKIWFTTSPKMRLNMHQKPHVKQNKDMLKPLERNNMIKRI